MRSLENRISCLEQAHGRHSADSHVIPTLFYPWGLSEDAFEVWRAERLRCDCTPGCPGKRVCVLVPEAEDPPC
jgi:hypothetical protein